METRMLFVCPVLLAIICSSLFCTPAAALDVEGNFSIVDGPSEVRGRVVEVLANGTWSSLCAVDWNLTDADYICQSLGFQAAVEAFTHYGGSNGMSCACTVNSTRSDYGCDYPPVATSCQHRQYAGVECVDPVSCGTAPEISFGCIQVTTTTPGSYAYITCQPGYRFVGSLPYSICQRNGSWTQPAGACTKLLVCSEDLTISNGNSFISNRSIGSVAVIVCDEGFRFNGSNATVSCSGRNATVAQWTSINGRCIRYHSFCERPPLIPFGYLNFNTTNFELHARIACFPGYEFVGFQYVICQRNGAWTQTYGKCERHHSFCELPAVLFGYLNIITSTRLCANVTCLPGYDFVGGNKTRCCQLDRSWTQPDGECETACPADCDFENGLCKFEDDHAADDHTGRQPFILQNRNTPRLFTDTKFTDHTFKNLTGHYIYLKGVHYPRNYPNSGSVARVITNYFHPLSTPLTTTFWYYMNGETNGTLRVVVQDINSTMWRTVWYTSNTQVNSWIQASNVVVDSANMFRVGFEAWAASGWSVDIALDDITFTKGWCTELPPPAAKPCTTKISSGLLAGVIIITLLVILCAVLTAAMWAKLRVELGKRSRKNDFVLEVPWQPLADSFMQVNEEKEDGARTKDTSSSSSSS
eukprot:scpid60737/ scgid22072/ Sushi, von Willebrand factor type A, EGF and pentraxin domain-containing protein 1